MSQQNIYPHVTTEKKQIEHKIMLLYLINKMDIPLSNSQITQFALEENYMNFYSVQQYLKEMVEIDYLDSSTDNNTTRYTITGDGIKALDALADQIPAQLKNRITKYVAQNRKEVMKGFETTANHFYDRDTGEYIVKCGVYDYDTLLMEINLSVVNIEQARIICNNWKGNVGSLHAQIINILLSKEDPDESRFKR
jgi:predicted transcriptional regulator